MPGPAWCVHTLRGLTPLSVLRAIPKVETSDAELMQRIADGRLEALGELYDRHAEGVRRFARRTLSSAAEGDDIVQETFLTVPKIASRYDGRPSARPYLLGIAARLTLRRRRGLGRLGEVIASFAATLSTAERDDPETRMSESEEMARFERALARLTDEKRVVLLMIEREGLSGEEVARALGIPVNTVWTRLHKARMELRKSLSRRLGK